MRTHLPRLALVGVLAIALSGCASAKAPTWTFGPMPSAAPVAAEAVAPTHAASMPPMAARAIEVEAFDLGFKPASLVGPRGRHVRGHLHQHRLHGARPDVRRRHEARRRRGQDGHRPGHRPGGRPPLRVHDPGPHGRRDDGTGHRGRRRHDARHQRGARGLLRARRHHGRGAHRPTPTPRPTSSAIRRHPRWRPARCTTSTCQSSRRTSPSATATSSMPGRSAAPSPGRRSGSRSATR